MSDWSCIIVYLNSSLVRCLNGPPCPNLRQSGSFVQTFVWMSLSSSVWLSGPFVQPYFFYCRVANLSGSVFRRIICHRKSLWLELVVSLSYRPFDWFLCLFAILIGSFVPSSFGLVPLSYHHFDWFLCPSSFWLVPMSYRLDWLVLCPIVLLIGSFVYSSVTNHPWRYFFWILQYSAYTNDYFFTNRVSIYTWTIMKKINILVKYLR